MIPVVRTDLPAALEARLVTRTNALRAVPSHRRKRQARAKWNSDTAVRSLIRARLELMAHGRLACMYCSDQLGTDVDHYKPLAKAPMRTYVWRNHILACGVCNSTHKRGDFPLDANRKPLFLDPAIDDPWDHLRLSFSTGLYRGITDRGTFTADRLLNHDVLALGRQAAWLDALDHVRGFARAASIGDFSAARQRQFRLVQRPNLDVFYALLKYVESGMIRAPIPDDVARSVQQYSMYFRTWVGLV